MVQPFLSDQFLTLFTLDMIDKLKVIIVYFMVSTLVGVFSFVYLSFVPGVFNFWMVSAFCVPLLAGLLEVGLGKIASNYPIRVGLYRLAIATITFQVILKGIYEIALTTFRGEWLYMVAWMVLVFVSVLVKE